MATATAKTETKITGVTLELTLQEAETLRNLVGRVGGPLSGPAGDCAQVSNALARAGVENPGHPSVGPHNRVNYDRRRGSDWCGWGDKHAYIMYSRHHFYTIFS